MGRWLEKKSNWLRNDSSNFQIQPENSSEDYGVTFIPLRCPRCRSKKVRCYAHRLPVRYHYCRKCAYRFKSVEKDYGE
jgi:predicted Zn-ribbon and HTH transcriptional regulator